jgi:hypothetical protein
MHDIDPPADVELTPLPTEGTLAATFSAEPGGWPQKEVHEYQRYRADVRNPGIWLRPRRLWGKWVKVARWRLYGRPWLLRRFGKSWPAECRRATLDNHFEIQGRDRDDEEWKPLSQWRLELCEGSDSRADRSL